jgi:hypothetical protein
VDRYGSAWWGQIAAPIQILCYILVQVLLGLASAILFVINCSSFILDGVTALRAHLCPITHGQDFPIEVLSLHGRTHRLCHDLSGCRRVHLRVSQAP